MKIIEIYFYFEQVYQITSTISILNVKSLKRTGLMIETIEHFFLSYLQFDLMYLVLIIAQLTRLLCPVFLHFRL